MATAAIAVPAAAAPAREIVIASEDFTVTPAQLDANVQAFARRLEQVAGWPQGSLAAKGFARPVEALAHIRKNKTAFAILPVHQFVEARRELRMEVLGRAVGLEGRAPSYWAIAKNVNSGWERVEDRRGLRLAMTEIYDLQWINVLFEAAFSPAQHLRLLAAKSDQDAVDAVVDGRADVAMLHEHNYAAIESRAADGKGDLRRVHTSGDLPPPPFVVIGKFVRPGDRKKLQDRVHLTCRDGNADVCARVSVLYIEPGLSGSYVNVVNKYETYPN